ncbi:acyl-CoA dehydrogenase family protein [Catenulispora sp. NF23]|uniref:Acyl-CoA dehydrogenase family protein n=1 Tax=Catenulispora pinistramenti TaxID=2705254 RepID=A0ABS5L6U0_9ACTN|nr:acyl-CoA dehydrogenase family protein [Catenulispora pinistramenti]MBS2538900.1 acyl-CoA dehydrogenase family protein [Catenulispora pinistramenti]MBS2554060.1 acyl-CoA dehydrogenase family protein [Catenulispora pinistramenti]
MDLTLTDEHEAIRALAADFTDRELIPNAAAWDRAEAVDRGIVKRLGDLGFLGMTIPEEYGGSAGDHLAYCLVMEELGRGDTAVRGIVSVSLGLVTKPLLAYGTEEQKRHWIPKLTAGDALGCFGLTEPGNGSDAGHLKTKAVKDGDGWRITGSKIFITNGTWADVALVFARTGNKDGQPDDGPRGITAFLVPTDTPGFQAREIKGKLGLRGQATAELVLEDVRVPDQARLGEIGQGFKIAMSTLDKGRMSVAAGCVGLMQACLNASVDYATQRDQFGKSIAHYQLVQEMLADISVDLDAGRLLVWRVADLIERGQPYATAASTAKLFCSEAAVRAANNAIQVFGGYGYIDEYPVGKYLRDARVLTLYEGTSQIQKLLLGRALTGVSAF